MVAKYINYAPPPHSKHGFQRTDLKTKLYQSRPCTIERDLSYLVLATPTVQSFEPSYTLPSPSYAFVFPVLVLCLLHCIGQFCSHISHHFCPLLAKFSDKIIHKQHFESYVQFTLSTCASEHIQSCLQSLSPCRFNRQV